MMKCLIVCATLLSGAITMFGQQGPSKDEMALSPPEKAMLTVGGKSIEIDYSSPRVRGRAGKIFSKDGLISHDPHYPVWRAGANAATTLKTSTMIMIGDLMMPAGTYTLFVDISDPAQWTLVVSKATGEWGLDYDKTKDLGRVKMKMLKPGAPVEDLKWTIKQTMGDDGVITLEWENMGASAPLMVH